MVAERPAVEEAALAEYGMKLGIAFQLVDDALDYVADQATLGKTIGAVDIVIFEQCREKSALSEPRGP